MKLFFKYLFKIFIACIIIFTSNAAFATPEITVTTQGTPVRINDSLIQNIIVSYKADAAWNISVFSLDSALNNISQSDKAIPIKDVYILDNLSANPYYFEPNKTIQIDSGTDTGVFNKKYALRITSTDATPPGIYTGTFKFNLTSGSDVATYLYTLNIDQPQVQKITIIPNDLRINVMPYDAMKKGYTISTNSPTKIMIKSNSNWKLVLKNDSGNNALKCQFKVTSSTGKSKIYYGQDYTDLPDNRLIIAEGEPTVTSDGKVLDTEVIQINYLFLTTADELQPSDNYSFNVNYDLTTY